MSLLFAVAFLIPSLSQDSDEFAVVDPSTVDWEKQIPFTGQILKTEFLELRATGDTGCYLNYDKPPFRLHCSLELTLGLLNFKDAVTKVEAGVEFEGEDLADIANHPTMTFYFGFKSPELALEIGSTSETLVEGRIFPENGGYYKKKVKLPGFERGFCVSDFAEEIPNKIVREVVESARWSGTDVCVLGKFDKITRETVNVALNIQLISLDDDRIPWEEEFPFWLSACYVAVKKLIDLDCDNYKSQSVCQQNDCVWESGMFGDSCASPSNDREIFKFVRKAATGSSEKFEKDINVGIDLLKLVREMESKIEKGTEAYEKWKEHHNSAQMLVSSESGAFLMGDQSDDGGLSAGIIAAIVISCVTFVALMGLAFFYRKQIGCMCCCKKEDQSNYQRMGVKGLVNNYERMNVNV